MIDYLNGSPAPATNVFVCGSVRVSVITDRLLRLEWNKAGHFEDRRTQMIESRDLGKVSFNGAETADGFTLDTGALKLVYTGKGAKFSGKNLAVTFLLNGKKKTWRPGDSARGNLLGTCRTLDGADGDELNGWNGSCWYDMHKKVSLCQGPLSRDGWAVIDDSKSIVIDRIANGGGWVTPRPEEARIDWYFFGYGHEYTDCLRDAAGLFGAQPLVPRFVLGYWWSRYWAYSDREIEELVTGFERHDVPIDVMVVDMDWHLPGWTGYTWDPRYFPNPDLFLQKLHRRGLKCTLNLHPANGVAKYESQFKAMAKAMKLDPAKIDRVPFDITDPVFMEHYFNILHHPEEKRGIDFWWMDWQQGSTTPMPGLDTLPWLNALHWEDMARREDNRRPLIFSRFGGIGAGRYAIGFSGDTFSTWKSLTYQADFTANAANVLYGYWSHDIGGHVPGTLDPELYLRWVQLGALSPVLRTHTVKNPDAERRFWGCPEPFSELLGDAVRQRYELVPYIYTQMRRACDTGVSLCRPLYYNYPEEKEAYAKRAEFFFGDDILAAPVTCAADPKTGEAVRECYLPPGMWYDTVAGKMEKGGRILEISARFEEVPLFVRPGTVIPGQTNCRRLNDACYKHLLMTVYPGDAGETLLYEDDGISRDYRKNASLMIKMAHRLKGKEHTITLKKESGVFYKGCEQVRSLEIRLPGTVPPVKVAFAGKELPCLPCFTEEPSLPAWRYDGMTAATVVFLPQIDLAGTTEVTVTYASAKVAAPDGIAANFRRLKEVASIHNSMGGCLAGKTDERLGQELSHTAVRISLDPKSFAREMKNLAAKLPRLPKEIRALAKACDAPRKEAARRACTILTKLK